MEKINDLFECAINDAQNAFPTIFSKEDVIYLLAKLRTQTLYEAAELKSTTTSCISEKLFTEFQTKVRDTMERYFTYDGTEAIDYDSAEFSIEYNNQLQLQNIDLNIEDISIKLDEAMLTHIEDVFGNLLILDQQ
jgi:hypothetical protein